MQMVAKSIFAVALVMWTDRGTAADDVDDFEAGCLYATMAGEKAIPILSCADADPLDLASNPDVQKAMRAFGIQVGRVRFKGCEKQRFATYPDASGASHAYVVTYPSEQKTTFLAPILHELAHVMQLEAAGGPAQLRSEYKLSKRIELGADYLTGVMFAKYFPDAELKLFSQNLALMGLYYEPNDRAHGTPVERDSAFRMGAFLKPDEIDPDLRKAGAMFQRKMYDKLVKMAR